MVVVVEMEVEEEEEEDGDEEEEEDDRIMRGGGYGSNGMCWGATQKHCRIFAIQETRTSRDCTA